jgi:hypothetical protein
MSFIYVALVAALTISALLAFSATEADAECNPGRPHMGATHYHDGRNRDGGGNVVWGVRAVLEEYNPFVHPSSYPTSAWVMLHNGTMYSQVGWLELSSGERRIFSQYTRPGGGTWTVQRNSWIPVGSTTFYESHLYGGHIKHFVNGVYFSEDTWGGFTPTAAQTAAETQSYGSQMPGGFNGNDTMAFVVRQVQIGGNWQDMGGSVVNSYPYWFGQYSGGANAVEIWDRACAY